VYTAQGEGQVERCVQHKVKLSSAHSLLLLTVSHSSSFPSSIPESGKRSQHQASSHKEVDNSGEEFEWERPDLDLLRKYPPPHKMLFHTNKFVGTIYFPLFLPHSDVQLDTY